MPLAYLALFRESTYRLLSQAFLYPEKQRLIVVSTTARQLRRQVGSMARFAFFGGWTRLLRFLEHLGQGDSGDIQGEFISLFVVNSGGIPCPPYESVHREPQGRLTGWLLAQVEREYAAAGLAPSPDLGELPDHVAVEMEFIAVLCGWEAKAWEERSLARGLEALRAQKGFLDRHLAVWVREFAAQLAVADGGGSYSVVGEGAQAFISHDSDLLEALLQTLPKHAEEALGSGSALP